MSWNMYDTFREHRMDPENGAISGTLKIAQVTGGYTPDPNADEFFDDISNEVSGAGYTAGGNEVANPGVTLDANGDVVFDGDDPDPWEADEGGFSDARRSILYYDTGTPSTSRLVAYSDDYGSDRGNADGDFAIELDENGIVVSPRAA